jgi:ketosteroid isomerase-like protein
MGLAGNKQAIHALLDAMSAGDEPAMRSLLTEDVRMWIAQSAAARLGVELPLAGRDTIAAVLAGVPQTFPDSAWTILDCVGEDDRVVMHARLDGRTGIGNEYHNSYLWLFRFEGDHIAEFWEYLDTDYAYERLGM